MRIYLDNCCYNRQHDESVSNEISKDKSAFIKIKKEIILKNIELATSFMLHYENNQNKNINNRNNNDFLIRNYRTIYIGVDSIEKLKILVDEIILSGVKQKEAYHIASAILSDCDYFITVDKKLLKYETDKIKIINLVDFIKILEADNND